MERIRRLWIILSNDATPCCNEPQSGPRRSGPVMTPELFAEVVGIAGQHSCCCSIVTNRDGMPANYRALLGGIEYEVYVPADGPGAPGGARTTVVCDGPEVDVSSMVAFDTRAMLRVRRADLGGLGAAAIRLLEAFGDVSIRHPELLSYDADDLETYKRQLAGIADWLLTRGADWSSYRIDRLTDRFGLQGFDECGAGDSSLAVGPQGSLHICPAAFHADSDPCGSVSDGVSLPNRHLLTRHYSLPCRGHCDAWHCSRCVYLSRIATCEFCVPAENVCRIAHAELEAQASLATRLREQGVWDPQKAVPAFPHVHDPYELIKDSLGHAPGDEGIWSRLVRFTGRVPDLSSPLMLDMIHTVQGRLNALTACLEAGCVPASELIENDPLISSRRKTVERYGNVVFAKGSPTINELDVLMHRAAEVCLERASGSQGSETHDPV